MLTKIGELSFVIHFINIWKKTQQLFTTYGSPTKLNSHLNGYINKQNMCICSTENPHTVMEAPLYPEKCLGWCATSSAGTVRPIFLDDTINAAHYLQLLKTTLFQQFKTWE
jgi:hypothetical protein